MLHEYTHFFNFAATADKPEEQCEMEGCARPKLQEGTRRHDYCSKSHADQDAPNRAGKLWICCGEYEIICEMLFTVTIVFI